jgi:hypothetical protein
MKMDARSLASLRVAMLPIRTEDRRRSWQAVSRPRWNCSRGGGELQFPDPYLVKALPLPSRDSLAQYKKYLLQLLPRHSLELLNIRLTNHSCRLSTLVACPLLSLVHSIELFLSSSSHGTVTPRSLVTGLQLAKSCSHSVRTDKSSAVSGSPHL